jgi:large subunit ribosomal protein L15
MTDKQERQGLHNLVAPRGARHRIKRIGRGESSGHGKTSTRGHKGQKARKSGNVRPGFEGGQMRLARRQPKRGFKNFDFKTTYTVVNVGRLAEVFPAGATVDLAALIGHGLVAKPSLLVKLLGTGDVKHALNVKVHKASASAKQKIESAGGTLELVPERPGPKADAK